MGEIVTLATLGNTVSATAELVTPSELAVMLVVPGPTPLAKPLASMVATFGELLDQARTPPLNTMLLASLTVAVNAWFWPTVIALVDGETVMVEICVVVVVVEELLPPPQLVAMKSASTIAAALRVFRLATCLMGNTTWRASVRPGA
jgi:hypothetical protein